MFDQHFLSTTAQLTDTVPLQGGERILWSGRCGVAEYAFDEAASMPRWTLPETTGVLVTDRRVHYVHTDEDGTRTRSGELRWLWPQHLRVQPGARTRDRGAAATQIQLVCAGADGTYPALVFAGGDLATVGDADRMANLIRQAIARFRIDNADKLGLTFQQSRMLSRTLIGPEFRNHQGGDGQTASLLGALPVNRPTAPPALPAAPAAKPEVAEGTRLIKYRPGQAADAARALMAAKAEQETQRAEPAIASRAADLAARVADMVNGAVEPPPSTPPRRLPRHSEPRVEHTEQSDPARFEVPTTNLAARAESMRRTAARMAANSGRSRAARRSADRDPGVSTRGNLNP